MNIDILSLFPEYFEGPFNVSMIKRAKELGLISIRLTNIRDFAEGKHRKVDDRPYGGGPGMVLMPGPVCRAIRSVKRENSHVVYLSPQGKQFDAQTASRLAKVSHLILVCGHYEGLDERVIEQEVDEEISIGDYVLTNGCLASIVVVDATARFIPGVLGHEEAAHQESFQQGLLEGPSYTRPEVFEGSEVPEVLKSGHHADIEKWRMQKRLEKTQRVRPELIKNKKVEL
jgi:tRNA (guanine37-N1)-methyltransferase